MHRQGNFISSATVINRLAEPKSYKEKRKIDKKKGHTQRHDVSVLHDILSRDSQLHKGVL